MKRRIEVEDEDRPSVVDRLVRAMAGQCFRNALVRARVQLLQTFDRASARAVACVAAAALFIAASILIVRGGLLGLMAFHVHPALAYLGIGLLALLAGWFILRAPSPPRGGNLN